ncbi:hypothetical protein JCM17961_18640 [Endothiovibrio diazotrophicus]
MNEQREPLRQCQNRPLVLILPAVERAHTKILTPDLWAIRTFCLDTENWIGALPAPPRAEPTRAGGLFPLSRYEQQTVDEWQRLWDKHPPGGLPKRAAPPAGLLQTGFGAFNALYAKRHLQHAEEVAQACLALARQTPEALRDLSVSLNNVGKTAQALGRWEDARAAFDESLAIRRQILQRVGETPEALRDLCVSLDNVADAARAQGDLDAGLTALREGLDIGERLAAALPQHAQYKGLADYFSGRLRAFGKAASVE